MIFQPITRVRKVDPILVVFEIDHSTIPIVRLHFRNVSNLEKRKNKKKNIFRLRREMFQNGTN